MLDFGSGRKSKLDFILKENQQLQQQNFKIKIKLKKKQVIFFVYWF